MSTCPTCEQEIEESEQSFSTRLRAARIKMEWSKQDLAEVLGYSRTTMITRWESGAVPPAIETVETLAEVLEVRPAWLLYGVQEPMLFSEADHNPELVEDEVEGEPVAVDESSVFDDGFDDDFDDWVEDDTTTTSSGQARPAILDRIKGQS